ncbi:MAG: chromate transporter [Alphaproteobacteria bacterium]|nr:chromate transporter [Alphaproteobacteria bacterium]
MIYIALFFSFFKIGLFAIGGGLATVPFLFQLSEETNWFSTSDLVKMIAISESTPGPLGVNMATYTGLQTAGVWGGLVATLGLVLPMLLGIIILCHFLKRFKESEWVEAIFQGLRPAVAMMIFGFVLRLIKTIFEHTSTPETFGLSLGIFLFYLFLTFKFKWHPITFIVLAAILGALKGLL